MENSTVIIVMGKNINKLKLVSVPSSMNANISGQKMRKKVFTVSKYLPSRQSLITKRKRLYPRENWKTPC